MTPEEYKEAIILEQEDDEQEIQDLETRELIVDKDIPIEFKKVTSKCSFNVLVKYSKWLWEVKRRLCFFVNHEKKLHGKVTNQLFPYKKKITLLKLATRDTTVGPVERLFFLHEPPERSWAVKKNVDVEFYIYTMIANQRQYLLFSEEEMGSEEYNIEGSLIEPQDYADIGHTFKLSTKLPMIFISKATPRIQRIKNHKELIQLSKKYNLNVDMLNNYLFSSRDDAFKGKSLRHPEYFERLIDALLFSTKKEGYPLHFLMLAGPGTGKTTLEECIHNKFNEQQPIVEGSGSTIKSLIPSFKETIPKVGALIQANRLCIIDEFLRILVRIKREEREHQLAMLNSLLEHKKRTYGSGNSNIEGMATAKLFCVSNAVYNTKTMSGLADQIDKSFLSRLIIWYQDPKHIKYIQERQGIQKIACNIDDNDWLSIYDYMNSFESTYDEAIVVKMGLKYSEYLSKFSSSINPIFDARYKRHHISLLLDGIIKTRCLCTQDASFTAKKEDYDNLDDMFRRLIENWTQNEILITREDVRNE